MVIAVGAPENSNYYHLVICTMHNAHGWVLPSNILALTLHWQDGIDIVTFSRSIEMNRDQ